MVSISSVRVVFKCESDIVVPPYTSKVSRSIVLKCLEIGGYYDVVSEIEGVSSRKPYIFSPIFYGGRPLYKTVKDDVEPLVLKRGVEYWFIMSIVGEEKVFRILESLMVAGEGVELLSGRVSIVNSEVKVVKFEDLGLEGGGLDSVHVKFLTPTLIQLPKIKGLKFREKLRHVLYPIPSLLIYSLCKHWNVYAPENLKIPQVEKLSKLADYMLVEVDYNVKPQTVIYDENRRPRGYVGWIVYKWNPLENKKKYNNQILKLLDYANYVGIGRSRTSGFGIVNVTPRYYKDKY